ncbi:YraN family protein [Patescibacteria group bacterium]|nr:YraN family protein [Patescibacteria group bacterium]
MDSTLQSRSSQASSQQVNKSCPPAHIVLGKEGELIAKKYLHLQGFMGYAENVHVGRDEIDLIVFDRKEKILVFVEVKTRRYKSENFRPEFNFTFDKQEKFERAVEMWMMERKCECRYRLDLICVAGGEVVDHFRNITF